MGLLGGQGYRKGLSPPSQEDQEGWAGWAGIWDPQVGRAQGVERLSAGGQDYLSSARMPTERDASAVTASTSSVSAPGTLGTQDSGQAARRCMQPQYLPGTRSLVREGWGKQVLQPASPHSLDRY